MAFTISYGGRIGSLDDQVVKDNAEAGRGMSLTSKRYPSVLMGSSSIWKRPVSLGSGYYTRIARQVISFQNSREIHR